MSPSRPFPSLRPTPASALVGGLGHAPAGAALPPPNLEFLFGDAGTGRGPALLQKPGCGPRR